MFGKNPIYLVGTEIDGNGNIINGITIKAPSSYDFESEDISKSNAGRTQDIEMHKNRIGRVNAINLSWENISFAEASKIRKAFRSEYVYVNCLDADEGDWKTVGFYTGNMSSTQPNTQTMKWGSLSFKIATRKNAL